jgi:hypothetical protein
VDERIQHSASDVFVSYGIFGAGRSGMRGHQESLGSSLVDAVSPKARIFKRCSDRFLTSQPSFFSTLLLPTLIREAPLLFVIQLRFGSQILMEDSILLLTTKPNQNKPKQKEQVSMTLHSLVAKVEMKVKHLN